MQAGRKKGLITCTEFAVFWLEKLTLRLTADIIIDEVLSLFPDYKVGY
jgi:hypothetical protein